MLLMMVKRLIASPFTCQGLKGDTGDKGDTGPVGPKGGTSPRQGGDGDRMYSFSSDKGEIGPLGLQGPKGDTVGHSGNTSVGVCCNGMWICIRRVPLVWMDR